MEKVRGIYMCLFVLTHNENMVFFLFPCTSHRVLFMNDIFLNHVGFFLILNLKDQWNCTMTICTPELNAGDETGGDQTLSHVYTVKEKAPTIQFSGVRLQQLQR